MTPEELHTLAVRKVTDRLKADGGVKALVADRVGGEPAELPCVVVTAGKRHDPPEASAPTLAQHDVRVESRAGDPSVRDILLVAVQRALNGQLIAPPDALQAVLHHTGDPDESDGTFARRDVFGVFVRQQPRAVAGEAAAARAGGGTFRPPADDRTADQR